MGNTQSDVEEVEDLEDPEDPRIPPVITVSGAPDSVSLSPSQTANPADERLIAIKKQSYDIIRDECCHEEREWVDPLFPADGSGLCILIRSIDGASQYYWTNFFSPLIIFGTDGTGPVF